MASLIIALAALLAVFVAWKVLKGIVKTVALVAILIVAAAIVFGGGMVA